MNSFRCFFFVLFLSLSLTHTKEPAKCRCVLRCVAKNCVLCSVFAWVTGEMSQKNPRVRKIFVRNSGAGNGCANFMDA